ncbi:MAG: hypothetical protein KAS25_04720, partial [Dehalococcoidales bacterium]|nr:hypothetical protein [Dehalococcoidales bacterium]
MAAEKMEWMVSGGMTATPSLLCGGTDRRFLMAGLTRFPDQGDKPLRHGMFGGIGAKYGIHPHQY